MVQTCLVQESTVSGTKEIQKTDGFPGGPVVKDLPSNAGDLGSIPGPRNKKFQMSRAAKSTWHN